MRTSSISRSREQLLGGTADLPFELFEPSPYCLDLSFHRVGAFLLNRAESAPQLLGPLAQVIECRVRYGIFGRQCAGQRVLHRFEPRPSIARTGAELLVQVRRFNRLGKLSGRLSRPYSGRAQPNVGTHTADDDDY